MWHPGISVGWSGLVIPYRRIEFTKQGVPRHQQESYEVYNLDRGVGLCDNGDHAKWLLVSYSQKSRA
jgi:hypothetical protein